MNTKYHQTEGFKFNPAGLIGLDAGTAKGISKFLRAHERDLNTFETAVMTCEGGPLNGQQIELEAIQGMTGVTRSAEFCIGAWRGYYLGAFWHSTLEANAPAPEAMAAPLPRPKINCDLPAKGFDQLRDLLGEMSINPLERETFTKPRTQTYWFLDGKTDDFGDTVPSLAPVGVYSVAQVIDGYRTEKRKKIPLYTFKVENHPCNSNAWAMDDFGDLFQVTQQRGQRETYIEKQRFTTYKIGRGSYTIPATIEAVERLAAKILKIKKWHSDKMHGMESMKIHKPDTRFQSVAQYVAPATEPQPAAIVIDTPPALLPKIEQPAKPLEPVSFLTPEQIAWMDQVKDLHNRVMAEQSRIKNERIAQFMRDAAPPPQATTCNPEAGRLRAKAKICRHANRPAWAKILEDKADTLDRVDPPEPPPCRHKRQRPRKTACILLAKIRHPVRQKFRPPPGIKTDTPSAHFYKPEPRIHPCHAHNLNPATHQPPRNKSKQSAAIYPWLQRPNFAASMLQAGKHGKQAVTACRRPFGGYSTSYWTTPSCRTKIKPIEKTTSPGNQYA